MQTALGTGLASEQQSHHNMNIYIPKSGQIVEDSKTITRNPLEQLSISGSLNLSTLATDLRNLAGDARGGLSVVNPVEIISPNIAVKINKQLDTIMRSRTNLAWHPGPSNQTWSSLRALQV